MSGDLVLQIILTVAAGLVGVGLYGALSQQSIVMIMMGLELALNGVLLAGGAAWCPARQRPASLQCSSTWSWAPRIPGSRISLR